MISTAFLQHANNGRLEPEIKSLSVGLVQREISVTYFLEKDVHRRRVPLSSTSLVAGHIPVVLAALRQLGIDPPEPNDYPDCLMPWFHRRIWKSYVRDVVMKLQEGASRPFFVKPLDKHKRFRGHLVQSWDDLRVLGGASNHAPVWCSDEVDWMSEYRIYVVHGTIVGVGHYAGDGSRPIAMHDVEDAVRCFENSGQAPAGYGIDFGVLSTGETALVEINDGYSLGSYGLDDAAYTDLIVARWTEMITGHHRA